MKRVTILIVLIFVLTFNFTVFAKELTVEVLSVNQGQNSILVKDDNNGDIKEYKIRWNSDIFLNNEAVSLNALRPITDRIFPSAIIEVDQSDSITRIDSFYKIINIEVKKILKNGILLKDLDSKERLSYKLDQKVEIIRNNVEVDRDDVLLGDSGVVILGINNKLKKIVLYHYEVSGVLFSIDYQKKTLTLNIGDRLNPVLNTYKIERGTEISSLEGELTIRELAEYQWVKLEKREGVNKIFVRRI